MTRYPSGPSSDLVSGWLKQTHNSFYKYSAATSFNSNLGMDHPKSNYKVALKLSGLAVLALVCQKLSVRYQVRLARVKTSL